MKRVLFIDVRNAARSPMAEAWFNALAVGWGRAMSCGTMPAKAFDLNAITVMAEVGVPIRPHLPRALNQQLLARAQCIVILGSDVPARAFPNALIWDFPDPTGEAVEQYRNLRDAIRERVAELAHSLHPIQMEAIPEKA